MAQTVLTMEQVEDIMLEAARQILGIPDDNSTVRLAYGARSPTGSAPMHDVKKNVVYITVNLTDDGYGKQHHISYENAEGADKLVEVDEYTEEYSVAFSCYGTEAAENARKLRDSLYSEKNKEYFSRYNLHFTVGSTQLAAAREIIDTIWVTRCDFTVMFYAYVRVERADAVDWYENVDIKFKT